MNLINNNNILLKSSNTNEEDLKNEINNIRKLKNAVILSHYYQRNEIQELADFVGDSLYLSQKADQTSADIIVFCGVHSMAETAKIISPEKKVLIPDLNAGCSLADSCKPEKFKKFLSQYPDHIVVTYINTSAEIKAMSDIICTSSNAVQIINRIPKDKNIIFAPDKNLGNYINSLTGRNMVIWDGNCHVHEEFSIERILALKKENMDAKIIAHPECNKQVLILADYIGSTSALLKYTKESSNKTFIVATEAGILYQMKKSNPEKIFIPAPPNDVTCGCSECIFMKMNTIEKVYNCLKNESPEIFVAENLRKHAEIAIQRMLDESLLIEKIKR